MNEVRPPGADAPAKGLAEAVCDVVDILRRRSSGSNDPDGWDRIVRIIAEQDSLPFSEVEAIEQAIAEAYRRWSDADRRSIWYETDSGMTDDEDDDARCDTSFNGIGYALQIELLDEVTQAAWRDAGELRKGAAKRSARGKRRTE